MRIGVVASSSWAPHEEVVASASAFVALAYPDVELVFHPDSFRQDGHFAGSDATRAAAFLSYANDPAFDAIWFLRGGYGSNRILHAVLPELKEAARHKAYAGFSDAGFLLGALYARRIGRPVHAPMVSDIRRKDGGATIARTLSWLARGDRTGLEPGLDGRPAAAFNLSILHALIGTPYLPELTDHVLLIEEVSEQMYAVDRMLFTLANATQLRGIAGVRVGAVSDVPVNDPPWGETLEYMIARWCGEMGVPYLGRAEIGHTQANRVVPFGVA